MLHKLNLSYKLKYFGVCLHKSMQTGRRLASVVSIQSVFSQTHLVMDSMVGESLTYRLINTRQRGTCRLRTNIVYIVGEYIEFSTAHIPKNIVFNNQQTV